MVTSRARERGFTLLELIVVVAMIGILASIAMPALVSMPRRAKESVLKTNLNSIRQTLDMFYGDKGRYPASLEELVETKYFRKIPVDPFSQTDDWTLVYEEESEDDPGPPPTGDEPTGPGVMDVRSSSALVSLDGTPYADW